MSHVFPETHEAVADLSKAWIELRTVLWGNTLVSVQHFKPGTRLVIGPGKHAHIRLEDGPLEHGHTLLEPGDADSLRINVVKGLEGAIEREDDSLALARVERELSDMGASPRAQLKARDRLRIDNGPVTYWVRLVAATEVPKVPFLARLEPVMDSLLVLFVLGFVLTTLYLKALPPPEVADIDDNVEDWGGRFTKVLVEQFKLEPPKPEKQVSMVAGAKAFREEGRIGKEDALLDKAKGTGRATLNDKQVADASGILGAASQESFEKMFGGGMANLDKHLGPLTGYEGEDMRGTQGLGIRGHGPGGGGKALGLGSGLHTRGLVGGDGQIVGIGDPRKLKHNGSLEDLKPEQILSIGYDKGIIARILKKHYSQIRYCYQRELQKNPTLYGKITVRFTIAGSGMVSKSNIKVSTMQNNAVEQCVARTIKRIVFPAPKDGGVVVVSYPFLFSVGGGD